ncbi:MAG: HalD/BesD family halogenase [Sciscionella sp.]
MTTVQSSMKDYLAGFQDTMDELRTTFHDDDYIEIPRFGPDGIREQVAVDVLRLLDTHAERREVHVASTGGTPRYFESVGRDVIAANSDVISPLFRAPAMLEFLAELTGEPRIVPVPFEPEEILINRMTLPGDSHGWHWDDYSFSLIWIFDAPGPDDGGAVEYVRDTVWDKDDPQIDKWLRASPVERRHPAVGSVYLLRADTVMHRVAPLVRDGARRTVMVFSYATEADLRREISHETIREVFLSGAAPTR